MPRVGSDLVKDTVDTAKTTAKAFKAGLNGEDIDLSGTKSRSGSNLAKGTKKAPKKDFEPQSVPPSRIPNLRMWTTFIKKQKD